MFPIGEAARRSGLKIPTIRFYEQEGLLRPPPRTASGRRLFTDADIRRLGFIRHARELGFELDPIRALLELAEHPERPCADADVIARDNLATVRSRITSLRALERELKNMIAACQGGAARDCRIIEAPSERSPRMILWATFRY